MSSDAPNLCEPLIKRNSAAFVSWNCPFQMLYLCAVAAANEHDTLFHLLLPRFLCSCLHSLPATPSAVTPTAPLLRLPSHNLKCFALPYPAVAFYGVLRYLKKRRMKK